MLNTRVKPQLRKCYQKSYFMRFVFSVPSSLNYTKCITIFVYNIVDILLIFCQFKFNRVGRGVKGEGAPLQTCTNKGGRGQKKVNFMWMYCLLMYLKNVEIYALKIMVYVLVIIGAHQLQVGMQCFVWLKPT